MKIITFFYNLLWGDLIIVPLPGGSTWDCPCWF